MSGTQGGKCRSQNGSPPGKFPAAHGTTLLEGRDGNSRRIRTRTLLRTVKYPSTSL
eukprot:m.31896 g.31896  ORF g.31896 m.31896 type:complete len:56 (-) comp14062_c1_seq1:2628-2795(-)